VVVPRLGIFNTQTTNMTETYRRFISRVSDICAMVAGASFALAVVVICYMVIRRTVGFPTDWELEFAVFMMVAGLFLGSPYALKTNGHVAVDLLETALPARFARPLRLSMQVLGLLVVLFLTYYGFEKALESFLQGEVTESSWHPPLWPLYSTMPIGFGLTALQYLGIMGQKND
jgi:TRAP-type C4-dicarboxylate transport system permease small subunit